METTPLLPRRRNRSIWSRLGFSRFRKRDHKSRVIVLGSLPEEEYPSNALCNQKYSLLTFLPLVLYEQFSFFLNLFFLLMSISQFIPSLRIGYWYTYWGPLTFVISVTVFREAVDDFRRYRRDKEVNRQRYDRVVLDQDTIHSRQLLTESVPASKLRVGDIVMLHKDQRVPADMLLLRTNETMGTVYVRTDQFDGEIDWKLRVPIPMTQKLPRNVNLLDHQLQFVIERPDRDIHSFRSTLRCDDIEGYSLELENTLWSGCVVASGQAVGLVIYTGAETRSVMNNQAPRSKVGLLDLKLNDLTKILFAAAFLLSFLLICLKGFKGPWYQFLIRFILLFSYIIPISLRVNLDLSKVFYSWLIQRDRSIAGTVMRSTTIPEDLGRINYLVADKTGTLTKNEMVFQRLQLKDCCYDTDSFHEVEALVTQYVTSLESESERDENWERARRLWEGVVAVALTHNVTPIYRDPGDDSSSEMTSSMVSESGGGTVPQQQLCEYRAASPDEVANVNWTDMMGVSLYTRDLHSISLKLRCSNEKVHYKILDIFPFTSESKMMGIIVQEEKDDESSGPITLYMKGADVAIRQLVTDSEWACEACDRMAADGLRTMVLTSCSFDDTKYRAFKTTYEANPSTARVQRVQLALRAAQRTLAVLAATGVEDRLADRVPQTLKLLTGAGIKVWMLTGDKLETALCIARSLGVGEWRSPPAPRSAPPRLSAHATVAHLATHPGESFIIDGELLEMCLKHYSEETMSALCACAGVGVSRCSPLLKGRVVRGLRGRGRVAAVGDGGNDVAMIQEADVGIGIEGVEGKSASLAADVSIPRVSVLPRLLLVHGRRSHCRSATLAMFVVHRGLIVSTMQAIFSVVFYFSSVSLYSGMLMVGYGTFYTMLPVFSLVLDKDLPSKTLLEYPQLYKQSMEGKQLSNKTFCIWTAISIYQGAIIMYGALLLFEEQLIHIVEISFTSLILTELIMVALTTQTVHWLMIAAELLSLLGYIATVLIFTSYFDPDFIRQWDFWWKVTVITAVSCLPLYVFKFCHKRFSDRRQKRTSNITTWNTFVRRMLRCCRRGEDDELG